MKPDLIDRYFASVDQSPKEHLYSLAFGIARDTYRRRHPTAPAAELDAWATENSPKFVGKAVDAILLVAAGRAKRGEI